MGNHDNRLSMKMRRKNSQAKHKARLARKRAAGNPLKAAAATAKKPAAKKAAKPAAV